MTFKKGQSGNPGGKSRAILELVELARSNCKDAIEAAVQMLDARDRHGIPNGQVIMAAACFLRDTGMGRPSQVEFDLAQVPDERLIEEVRRRGELRREQQAIQSRGVDGSSLHS